MKNVEMLSVLRKELVMTSWPTIPLLVMLMYMKIHPPVTCYKHYKLCDNIKWFLLWHFYTISLYSNWHDVHMWCSHVIFGMWLSHVMLMHEDDRWHSHMMLTCDYMTRRFSWWYYFLWKSACDVHMWKLTHDFMCELYWCSHMMFLYVMFTCDVHIWLCDS